MGEPPPYRSGGIELYQKGEGDKVSKILNACKALEANPSGGMKDRYYREYLIFLKRFKRIPNDGGEMVDFLTLRKQRESRLNINGSDVSDKYSKPLGLPFRDSRFLKPKN